MAKAPNKVDKRKASITERSCLSGYLFSSSSEVASFDGDGNKCNGQCNKIYPIQNGHIDIKDGVGILGTKDQFCAAFYHVHQWGNRKHSCLDEDNCIIAQGAMKRIKDFEDDVKKFPKQKDTLVEELRQLVENPTTYEKVKKFVEKVVLVAKNVEKPPDEETLDNLAKTARKAVYAWCVQAKTVVAVVKFETKKNEIKYEARYTNCDKEKKHAEDFFKEDIEKGELRNKVKANPNGTITMYLTLQPCNKSTSLSGTANTPADKTCCETLNRIIVDKILPGNTTLCVKAANTCRLSLTKEAKEDDETLRQCAVDGIEMLMQIKNVNVCEMNKEDWNYLFNMANFDVLPNYDYALREHLDKSVQKTFTDIKNST